MLRQHVADMYRAWMTGKTPPPPPPNFLDAVLTQTPDTMPGDPPPSPYLPAYHSFPSHPSSSITRRPTIFSQKCPPVTSTVLNNEHPPKAHNAQYYPSEVAHDEVLRMGELVEEGIKSGKIMSCSKDIPNIPASLGGGGGSRKGDPMSFPDQHSQPRHRPRGHPCTPGDPSQSYFSPHNSQSHTPLFRYPALQNAYLPPRACQKPPGSGFRPNQACRDERLRKKKDYSPLEGSYANLFQRLRSSGLLKPIQIKIPNPLSKTFDFSQRCAYCSDAPGHDIERCWNLKKAVQKLIDAGDIVVPHPDAVDTSQSPSPVHNETHMVGMIYFEKECENSSGSLGGPRATKLSALSEVDLENEPAKGTQKQLVKNDVMRACEAPSIVDTEFSSISWSSREELWWLGLLPYLLPRLLQGWNLDIVL